MNAGAVLVLGIVLVLFINLAAPLFLSNGIAVPDTIHLVAGTDAADNPVTVVEVTPGPPGYTTQNFEAALPGDPLDVVKYLSVVGVILIGVIGFFTSQWIARKSLHPVNAISQAAQSINPRTLDQRINYQGAQDEVKVLADAFDTMLMRLELNFKDQNEFSSNLAHEVRTPLTSLLIDIDELDSDPQATLDDFQEFVRRARHNLTRLERLIEDLLLLARGENQIGRQIIFLGVLLEEVLDELRPIANEHNISLTQSGDIELIVSGNPVMLHKVVANLVENGIHYNQPSGFVEISTHREKNQAVIEVRDNGLGISMQQQAKLFQRFNRGSESIGHNSEGIGLGLAITAHIVHLHEGKISVNSTLGKGTIFRIELPLHPKEWELNN